MLQHFNKITKDELKNFKKFVNSPYFNSNKNIVKLFDYLSSKYPDISEEHVSYAAISQNVFSKDQINQDGIRKLLSDFMKLMEDYFMHSYLQRDIVANRISMLNTLRERGFTKRFEMNMNDLFKSQKRLFQKNDIDYTNQSNLESQYFEYYKSRFRNEHAECLQNISDMRDFSFIFSKLHIFFEMYINEGIGRKKFDKKFYNEIISFIEKNKNTISKLHPNIYIIYLVLLMHDTLDDKFFFKLEDY